MATHPETEWQKEYCNCDNCRNSRNAIALAALKTSAPPAVRSGAWVDALTEIAASVDDVYESIGGNYNPQISLSRIRIKIETLRRQIESASTVKAHTSQETQ